MADNVSVKITADVVDLQAKFAVAKAESNALTAELNKLARQAAQNGMTDELKASLTQAAEAAVNAKVKFSDLNREMQDQFKKSGESGKDMDGLLHGVLTGAVFLEYEEIAKQALEAVQQAFEKTVGKAEEFGLSNAKFAAIIGTTAEGATGLSEALKGVGVSTEQYETMALRLGENMGKHEAAFKKFGVATRDASNDLLGGKAAMDAVFTAMEKNPAERNAIAFDAFGRKALDAFDIMRAGGEDAEHVTAILKEMGVQTDDTSGSSAKLESSLNDMRVML